MRTATFTRRGNFAVSPNASGIAQIIPPTAIGGNGSAVVFAGGTLFGATDGTGSAAQFGTPRGMATDAAGNIYVADSVSANLYAVRKVAPQLGAVTTLSGLNGVTNIFGSATSVAVSATGTIFVSGGTIYQYVPGGTPLQITFGPITDAQSGGTIITNYPTYGVAIDQSNALYATARVAGPFKNMGAAGGFYPAQLYVLKREGSTTTPLYALPLGDNNRLQANLDSVIGTIPIAVDTTGNVYVGWYGNLYLYRGQTGPTSIASFNSPIVGLATDSAGRIYVATNPLVSAIAGVGPGQITVVAPAGVSALPPQPTSTPTTGSAARLLNISTRAFVGSGGNIAIAGFVISGGGE